MTQIIFDFNKTPWEQECNKLHQGDSISAVKFLALLEGEDDDAVEDAFRDLQNRHIMLDISDLPEVFGSEQVAVRLRREAQLVKENKLPQVLEENDPLRLYLEELAAIPVCGDTQILAQRCLQGDENAMLQLTNQMLSRVISCAYELAGRGVLLLDLIQEGSLSLWQAILDYEGGDFEAYCDRCIRMTLAKAVTLQARANGIGQKMQQAMEDYRAVDEQLLTELGRNPTLEEIAAQLHMTVEEAICVAETLKAARMMDKAKADSKGEQEQKEENLAVEDTAYFQMRQRVQELLSGLEEMDAKLLTMRFGLEGGLPVAPEDVGERLGLTREEVVAREAAALEKLRASK